MKFKKGDIVIDKDGEIGIFIEYDENDYYYIALIGEKGDLLNIHSWGKGKDLKPYQLKNISKKNAIGLALLFDVEFEEFEKFGNKIVVKDLGYTAATCSNMAILGHNTKLVKNTKTITIDGKDIEISEESFNELKKSLIKE